MYKYMYVQVYACTSICMYKYMYVCTSILFTFNSIRELQNESHVKYITDVNTSNSGFSTW